LLDELRLERVPIVGHSSGGWTALGLAVIDAALRLDYAAVSDAQVSPSK
jgi:hypothetical protein